jgi:hypothetical protein
MTRSRCGALQASSWPRTPFRDESTILRFRRLLDLWGFTKVRYRGLEKNTARLFIAFTLANLYLLRRRSLPMQARCLP